MNETSTSHLSQIVTTKSRNRIKNSGLRPIRPSRQRSVMAVRPARLAPKRNERQREARRLVAAGHISRDGCARKRGLPPDRQARTPGLRGPPGSVSDKDRFRRYSIRRCESSPGCFRPSGRHASLSGGANNQFRRMTVTSAGLAGIAGPGSNHVCAATLDTGSNSALQFISHRRIASCGRAERIG